MTTINSIANLLVTSCGLSEVEAFEMAEFENVIAERAYINFAEEEARDAEEIAYWARIEEEERAYYERNYKPFMEWTAKNISGKSFEDIAPETWDYYSDWHKDLYGFRPRYIPVKVERSENVLAFYSPEKIEDDYDF